MVMQHTSVFQLGKLRLGVSLVAQSEQPSVTTGLSQFLPKHQSGSRRGYVSCLDLVLPIHIISHIFSAENHFTLEGILFN